MCIADIIIMVKRARESNITLTVIVYSALDFSQR